MRRRLFVQIYLSFVGISLLTLLAGALAVRVAVTRTLSVPSSVRVATEVLIQTLPDPSQAPAEFRAGAVSLARRLGVQASVWSVDGRLLARVGERRAAPPDGCPSALIRSSSGDPGLCFQVPDGRWVAFTGVNDSTRRWLLRAAGVALAIFGTIALGCFPLARRITRRLETLQDGVRAFGDGALDHRVTVSGKDEVADLAAAFNASADRVAALVEGQRRVLAHASHELRSPLARLRVQLALLEEEDDAAQRSAVAREADGDIQTLDGLIEDVLLASRLRGGVAVPRSRDQVALPAVVADLCHRHGLPDPELLSQHACVLADERLVRRALENLISNAKRHGRPPLSVVVFAEDEHVCVDVRDRGPGVVPSERSRIFEPFYRQQGHAEGDPGVGLGLSLVQEITRHHGGSVECRSRRGAGACFRIRLPKAILEP